MIDEPREEGVVAVGRDALPVVVEVVDVVVRPHGHALDDRRVDLLRRLVPLLRRVVAEERVEDRGATRVRQKRGDFGRRELDAEELVDEREAERQEVVASVVLRDDLVLVAVERREAVDERPDLGDVRVEDVRAVEVDFDARRLVRLAADVPADGGALLEDEHAAARLGEPPRERATPDARAHDERVERIRSLIL